MPPRKRPEQRIGRGTADLTLASPIPVTAPPPPHPGRRKLLKVTVEAWSTFWQSDLAALVNDADRPALDRLFRMYDQRERFDRLLLAEPFTTGSTGQLVTNPAAKEVASLDGRIRDLEDRFGLTPKARLQLGITLGAAAKSLDDLNRGFAHDLDDDPETDPRLAVIEVEAREA